MYEVTSYLPTELQYTVGVVLIVVVEPGGEGVECVPHQLVDECLQLWLGAAQVEARAERRHRAATAEAG